MLKQVTLHTFMKCIDIIIKLNIVFSILIQVLHIKEPPLEVFHFYPYGT